jgi:adenine-specific DNA-methyltransferase
MKRLASAGRIHVAANSIRYRRFNDDFPYQERGNIWTDTITGNFTDEKIYAVQTNLKVIERCILLSSDPGDLVFDSTCGSGTTAVAAEKNGRRWITCDTSRVAIALAKQRVMTAIFDYYRLAHPEEGVGSGFQYQQAKHVTLESIANSEPAPYRDFFDQPLIDTARVRVTGPFTVEAVPAPVVRSIDDVGAADRVADSVDGSIARSGETQRQGDWRDELLNTGIRGKGGQRIEFSRVEPLPGPRWLHADAETKEDKPQRVVVSFGPDHAPIEQRQVELALGEAETLRPKPKIIVFAAFQFDP